jgi:hypothetical protein
MSCVAEAKATASAKNTVCRVRFCTGSVFAMPKSAGDDASLRQQQPARRLPSRA